jgi:hypothetical protein
MRSLRARLHTTRTQETQATTEEATNQARLQPTLGGSFRDATVPVKTNGVSLTN